MASSNPQTTSLDPTRYGVTTTASDTGDKYGAEFGPQSPGTGSSSEAGSYTLTQTFSTQSLTVGETLTLTFHLAIDVTSGSQGGLEGFEVSLFGNDLLPSNSSAVNARAPGQPFASSFLNDLDDITTPFQSYAYDESPYKIARRTRRRWERPSRPRLTGLR